MRKKTRIPKMAAFASSFKYPVRRQHKFILNSNLKIMSIEIEPCYLSIRDSAT